MVGGIGEVGGRRSWEVKEKMVEGKGGDGRKIWWEV